MKPPAIRYLSVLLVVTLLLCHGAFGALHLFCHSLECLSDAEHWTEIGRAVGDAHDHPADHGVGHGTSAGYFAVVVFGLLWLLLELLSRRALADQPCCALARGPWSGARRIPSSTCPHTTLPTGVHALKSPSLR
jgi:hypothetical protein